MSCPGFEWNRGWLLCLRGRSWFRIYMFFSCSWEKLPNWRLQGRLMFSCLCYDIVGGCDKKDFRVSDENLVGITHFHEDVGFCTPERRSNAQKKIGSCIYFRCAVPLFCWSSGYSTAIDFTWWVGAHPICQYLSGEWCGADYIFMHSTYLGNSVHFYLLSPQATK